MVSALDSGLSGPGSSPGRGHCLVLLGKTLYLTVPLSTQVYKWVPTNDAGGTLRWTQCFSLHPGGVEIFLIASSYRNRVKAHPDGPLGSYANFSYWSRYMDDWNSLPNNLAKADN